MENDKLKCRGCSEVAVMICLCDTVQSRFCEACLPQHLMKATEKAHTLLPLQAFPFIQNKKDQKFFFEKMKLLDELVGRINTRLERLLFSKEQAVLQIQLASEELKRLIDKELETAIESIKAKSEKHEYQLKSLKQELEEIRYAKDYSKDTLSAQLMQNKELADQLLLEPLEFHLQTDHIMQLLPKLVNFYFREITPVSSQLVKLTEGTKHLVTFKAPKTHSHHQIEGDFLFKRAMGVCVLPDGSVFCAGGREGETSSKESAQLSPALTQAVQVEEMSTPRDSFALTYFEKSIYSFGGYQAQTKQAISHCERFDMTSGEWTQISSLSEAKSNVTALVHGDIIYVAGKGSKLVEKYDPSYDCFTSLGISLSSLGSVRLLPGIEDSIIVLQTDKFEAVKLESEVVVKERQVPTRNWWGVCSPMLQNKQVYFLEHNWTWVYNYTSGNLELVDRVI